MTSADVILLPLRGELVPFAIYHFGEFSLQCARLELTRKGHRIKVERKPLELLVLLVTRNGQIVTREEIARHLWEKEVFVDVEHGINTAVRKLRQTLGDSSEMPRFVQTISGSGYRFIATVRVAEPPVSALSQSPSFPSEPIAALPVAPPQIALLPELPFVPPAPSPGKRPHRSWPIAALCAAVLLAIAVLVLWRHPFGFPFIQQSSRVPIGSIAVLPLENLSSDPSQDYFADGMTDELITELARIPHLRVVSRTSVMAVGRDATRSLPEIAGQLGVDAIVEGSIVRSGDRIRITAQLIDAHTDRHLWAQSFEGPAADVISLQDEVAAQIATQASFVVAPPTPRPPVNPAAHDAYLRGLYFFHKQDFARSVESFKQAVTLDPAYASAYAGYASALEAATTWSIGTPQQLMPQAVAAATRAIELDPQNGEAYTVLGSIETIYDWDWPAAERNLSRGLALNPNNSIAEFKYAVYLDAVGRTQDAVTHMRRALQLDPLSFLMTLRLGVALYYNRQYDEAIAQLGRAAEMERSSPSVERYLGFIYEKKGDPDKAMQHSLAQLRNAGPQVDVTALLNEYQRHGWKPYWRAHARRLIASNLPCTQYELSLDALRTDDLRGAFASLNQAIDGHCFSVAFMRVDPLLDRLREDPRYAALLARMHW